MGGVPQQTPAHGSPYLHATQEVEMADLAELPSDDALLAEIRDILKTADLMTVTKKGIKAELEKRFECGPGGLDLKRAYINSGTLGIVSCLTI